MKAISENFRKIIPALFLGPLAIIPAFIFYAIFMRLISEPNSEIGSVAGLFILGGLVIAYVSTLILGVPVALILSKLGKFTLPNLLVYGFVLSMIYSLFVGWSLGFFLFLLYFVGAVVLGCWLIYRAM
ncbi:hypothetical protein [Microbulbifer hydrolyticus]|uniref:DUF3147 family protein n=1 Tax=Microbulbifer hydrolyticus TaxID=48074 RepID=A0A6P1TA02_9GAMM|nr:hypothetical protein [Microbulbifer hydrolyticus]MBB5213247.1 hypothetical protein [Microbulbifer hydrolyticus]QHQ38493.1 hypothetical protein GTQ55_05455 [Microbulbifer hydrolyticus]